MTSYAVYTHHLAEGRQLLRAFVPVQSPYQMREDNSLVQVGELVLVVLSTTIPDAAPPRAVTLLLRDVHHPPRSGRAYVHVGASLVS